MQEGTRDIQSAVKFRMGYTLVQREPRSPREGDPLPNINQYPILNQQEASKTFQATFEKDCGDNDVCESNVVTVANLDLPQGMPTDLMIHFFKNEYEFCFVVQTFFPFLFSSSQEKTAFPFWNWANSKKSSSTFPLRIQGSRHTRPDFTSPILER